jgi:hypothetical protein
MRRQRTGLVVAVTAVVMALWRPNPFLAMVAVFSFYFSFTARRVLLSRRPDRGERATALDRGAAVAAAVTSAALVVLGAVQPGAVWVRLGPVAVVFGVLGHLYAGAQLRRFARPPADPTRWWFVHMTGDARLLHRRRDRVLGRELHLPAGDPALAVADLARHAADRGLVTYYRRRFVRRWAPETAAA